MCSSRAACTLPEARQNFIAAIARAMPDAA